MLIMMKSITESFEMNRERKIIFANLDLYNAVEEHVFLRNILR